MKVHMKASGSFKKSFSFLLGGKKLTPALKRIMIKYGESGVEALRTATPKDSGETSDAWGFVIKNNTLYFTNSNEPGGFSVALGLQYGHGTRNGAYVQGVDYINPVVRPIFDKIAADFFREVNAL